MAITTFNPAPTSLTGSLTTLGTLGNQTRAYNGTLPVTAPVAIASLVPLALGDSVAVQNNSGGQIRVGAKTIPPVFFNVDFEPAMYAVGSVVGQAGWINGPIGPSIPAPDLNVVASTALGGTQLLEDGAQGGPGKYRSVAKPFLLPIAATTPFSLTWDAFLTSTSGGGNRETSVSFSQGNSWVAKMFYFIVHDDGSLSITDGTLSVLIPGVPGLHTYRVVGDALSNLFYYDNGVLIATGTRGVSATADHIVLLTQSSVVDPAVGSIRYDDFLVMSGSLTADGFLLPAGSGVVISAQLAPLDLFDLSVATNAGDPAAGISLLVVGQ